MCHNTLSIRYSQNVKTCTDSVSHSVFLPFLLSLPHVHTLLHQLAWYAVSSPIWELVQGLRGSTWAAPSNKRPLVCSYQGYGTLHLSPPFPERHPILIGVIQFWWMHCHLSVKMKHHDYGQVTSSAQMYFPFWKHGRHLCVTFLPSTVCEQSLLCQINSKQNRRARGQVRKI